MRFSQAWLREWVDAGLDTEALVARLTAAGLEVDAVEPVAGPADGVVVGEVLEVAPHPDADRLRVCRVDAGQGEPLTVVCGAPNVAQGMRAPTALVGARLPNGMAIEQARIRGVESFGMLCSAQELGLAETSEGLLALPADAPVGRPLVQYLALDDVAIEVDLTPNRSDCLSVSGIAREVGALTRRPVAGPAIAPVPPGVTDTFPVYLEAPVDCPSYVGRVIRGVDPAARTPLWMRERLRRSGLRSISPAVDVTNYVMLELGQPMHAFDLGRLTGAVRVRRARSGEALTLLDGSQVNLDPETLVIADDSAPLAMAGVMGGLASAVTGSTRDMFLESAFFAPAAIAGRARRYGLATDSSHRFERGVDFELQRLAVERATRLILDIMGGQPGPVIEAVAPEHMPRREPIALRQGRLERVLGMAVAPETVADVLTRLGMAVEAAPGGWQVTAPSSRFDMAIEVDLIEEVARVLGYDQVPTATPVARLDLGTEPEALTPLDRLRDLLADRDYQEAITYSFVDPALQARFDPEGDPIALSNPISADMAVMRTTLWPGLIQALRHNQNRQQTRVRLFETGLRFVRADGETRQVPGIAGVAAGPAAPEQWGAPQREVDFFDMKGDVEALLAHGGVGDAFRFVAGRHPALHPGQTAQIERDGAPVGWLGALHPALVGEFDLPGRVYLFELELPAIQAGGVPVYSGISRFPAIRRDISVLLDRGISAQQVTDCIGQAAPDVLKKLQLFDVYEGKGIDSGKKSLALALTLQAPSRTLTDDEVDVAVGRVVEALKEQLGAVLRA